MFPDLDEADRQHARRIAETIGAERAENLLTWIALQEPPLQADALCYAVVVALATPNERVLAATFVPEWIDQGLELVARTCSIIDPDLKDVARVRARLPSRLPSPGSTSRLLRRHGAATLTHKKASTPRPRTRLSATRDR